MAGRIFCALFFIGLPRWSLDLFPSLRPQPHNDRLRSPLSIEDPDDDRRHGRNSAKSQSARWQSDVIVDLDKRLRAFPTSRSIRSKFYSAACTIAVITGENDPPILLCNHETKLPWQISHGMPGTRPADDRDRP